MWEIILICNFTICICICICIVLTDLFVTELLKVILSKYKIFSINMLFYDLHQKYIEHCVLYLNANETQDLELIQSLILQSQNNLFVILIIIFWYLNILSGVYLLYYQFELFKQGKTVSPFTVLLYVTLTLISTNLVDTYVIVPQIGIFATYPPYDILRLFSLEYKIYRELKKAYRKYKK